MLKKRKETIRDTLLPLKSLLELSDTDIHVADMIGRRCGIDDETTLLAAALTGRALREGHTCLAYDWFTDVMSRPGKEDKEVPALVAEAAGLNRTTWKKILKSLPGVKGEISPLTTGGTDCLYYYRYRAYEEALAQMIRERTGVPAVKIKASDPAFTALDWAVKPDAQQKKAILAAVNNRFAVISGGPGTGKTTLVVGILQLLARQARTEEKEIVMKLAAPTGKAAKRLGEAVAAGCAAIKDTEVQGMIPGGEEAQTLHRLLRATGDGMKFRADADNPVRADVIVVDEASMIDIRLMHALFSAVQGHTRLILLGDPFQLTSVDAGSVLADICAAGGDHLVTLKKNYRFKGDEGIDRLSTAVNEGDADLACEILEDPDLPDAVQHIPAAAGRTADLEAILAPLVKKWGGYTKAGTPEEALEALHAFRVLCAVHEGRRGVKALNAMVEKLLVQEGILDGVEGFYPYRPVIVLQNDYTHNVFNGDIGIVWPYGERERLVHFENDRTVSPYQLPDHASAFALTVHKSQGSEFGRVLLVLPEKEHPVVTRQLLYTAATRAKSDFGVYATGDIIRAGVENRAQRWSGLEALLKTI